MRKILFILFLFCFPLFTFASSKPKLTLSTNVPLQGDVVIATLQNSGIKKATYKGKAISFFPYRGNLVTFIPISGTEPKSSGVLRLTLSNGSLAWRTIWIQPRKFVRVSLGIPAGSSLTTASLIDQLQKEKILLEGSVKKKTDTVYFNDAFQLPLSSYTSIASPFGEIRKTGSSIIRHWGIDYAAPTGTPVYAISGGTVAQSYLDTTYGNTIIIDHGQGVFSMYMHLNERLKREGESVTRGELIGKVGNTGYSFGPHLHLSLKVNGISVDPQKFIDSMK